MDEASPEYAKIMAYIDQNPAAVLSTVDDTGTPHGAVIYAVTGSHHTVCFVTKTSTQKYKNIQALQKVALTIFNERDSSTLQIAGQAFIAEDNHMVDYVLGKITKLHAMQAEWLPPVTKVEGGEFAVVGIEIQSARLTEFQGMGNNKQTTTL